jgi:hypothetical protein
VDLQGFSKTLCFDNTTHNIDFTSGADAECMFSAKSLIFENPIVGEYLEICDLTHFSMNAFSGEVVEILNDPDVS